jgi:hypothetical protein
MVDALDDYDEQTTIDPGRSKTYEVKDDNGEVIRRIKIIARACPDDPAGGSGSSTTGEPVRVRPLPTREALEQIFGVDVSVATTPSIPGVLHLQQAHRDASAYLVTYNMAPSTADMFDQQGSRIRQALGQDVQAAGMLFVAPSHDASAE